MRIVTILAAACQSRGLFIGARFHLGSGLARSSGAPPVDAVATALQRVCPRLLEDPARFP